MTDITVKYDIGMTAGFITIEAADNTEVPHYVENMLLNNNIGGFLRFGVKEIDNKKSFVYDISAKTSLKKICDKKKLDAGMIRGLMKGIFIVLEECERYLLSEEDIILKPEYIFFDEEDDLNSIAVCYYPGYGEMIKDRFNELLGELINYLDYKDKEAVTLLYELYSKTGEEDCTVDSLVKILGVDRKESADPVKRPIEKDYEEFERKSTVKTEECSELSEKNKFWEKIKNFFVSTETEVKPQAKVMLKERTVLLSDFSILRKYMLVNEDHSESIFMDKTPFYIGKKENSMDLVINEDTISRIHAKFTLEKSGCYLEDLNSTNGTFINGNRLKEGVRKKLEEGDVVAFAERRYIFELA